MVWYDFWCFEYWEVLTEVSIIWFDMIFDVLSTEKCQLRSPLYVLIWFLVFWVLRSANWGLHYMFWYAFWCFEYWEVLSDGFNPSCDVSKMDRKRKLIGMNFFWELHMMLIKFCEEYGLGDIQIARRKQLSFVDTGNTQGKGADGSQPISKKKNSYQRWSRPCCHTIIRSTKTVNIICGDCGEHFIRDEKKGGH